MPASLNPIRWKLHWQILLALGLSLLTATLLKGGGLVESAGGQWVLGACDFVGTLFMNALKMIVVPLIVASIIAGMAGLGSDRAFGRLGLKTLLYYTTSGLLAIMVGLLFVNLIQPGNVSPETAEAIHASGTDAAAIQEAVQGRGTGDFLDVLKRMIPTNVFAAADDNGQLLGVIFFSLLVGVFIARLPEPYKQTQENLWEGFRLIMTKLADIVIATAPIGVFALVTPKLTELGLDLFAPLAKFTATVLLSLGFHLLVTLSILLWVFARVNPLAHLRAMASALLTAFSTASSVSTLPVTLECVEDNAGVSKRVATFTCPLGATVNMDGTALFECIVVIFIAQISGAGLDLTGQLTVVLLALMTSIGVAGIPSASMVAIAVILQALDLPVELIALYLPIDRLLDMCRTAVNIYSDSVGAVLVAKSEGEEGVHAGG